MCWYWKSTSLASPRDTPRRSDVGMCVSVGSGCRPPSSDMMLYCSYQLVLEYSDWTRWCSPLVLAVSYVAVVWWVFSWSNLAFVRFVRGSTTAVPLRLILFRPLRLDEYLCPTPIHTHCFVTERLRSVNSCLTIWSINQTLCCLVLTFAISVIVLALSISFLWSIFTFLKLWAE